MFTLSLPLYQGSPVGFLTIWMVSLAVSNGHMFTIFAIRTLNEHCTVHSWTMDFGRTGPKRTFLDGFFFVRRKLPFSMMGRKIDSVDILDGE